jgi:heterodisulfide reductase subunit C
VNSKNYRDAVLEYVQKLGEIDRFEDELFEYRKKGNLEQAQETEKNLGELKKEASNLKEQIESHKRKK